MRADARDQAAVERDAAASARDLEAADRDAELDRLPAGNGTRTALSGEQIVLRAAPDRQRVQDGRERAAAYRVQAARDRRHAARDRELAARDRAQAAAERNAAAVDALTGAWQRGPGLKELDHEIARARRGNGRLIAVYVDVNGLKAINDSRGHAAGDTLLTNIVAALRAHLRPYELVVRVGGDEFLCALADASLDDVRRRFDGIIEHLQASPDAGPITVGFAELSAQDSATDLMQRADQDFLAAHSARQ